MITGMEEMKRFGDVIRDAMMRQGIEGQWLAPRLGMSASQLSNWINGEKKLPPSAQLLTRFAKELHLSKSVMLEALGYLDIGDGDPDVSYAEQVLTPVIRSIDWDDDTIFLASGQLRLLADWTRQRK